MSVMLRAPCNSNNNSNGNNTSIIISSSGNNTSIISNSNVSETNSINGITDYSSNNGGASPGGPSSVDHEPEKLVRQFSTTSFLESDEEDEGCPKPSNQHELVLGPLLPLKQQLEKDKEDESLRRWKQQLLGTIQLDGVEDGVDPEVTVLSLSIQSPGRQDIVIDMPSSSSYKNHLFTLKEGSIYNLKFTFAVRRNIVSGLTYVHTVWKNGLRVDNTRVMLGTFAPQCEPHVVVMDEETTPSGMLARGTYSAKTKFIDDDGRCHFEIEHTFDIRKEW